MQKQHKIIHTSADILATTKSLLDFHQLLVFNSHNDPTFSNWKSLVDHSWSHFDSDKKDTTSYSYFLIPIWVVSWESRKSKDFMQSNWVQDHTYHEGRRQANPGFCNSWYKQLLMGCQISKCSKYLQSKLNQRSLFGFGSNPRLSVGGSNLIQKVPHMERLLSYLIKGDQR